MTMTHTDVTVVSLGKHVVNKKSVEIICISTLLQDDSETVYLSNQSILDCATANGFAPFPFPCGEIDELLKAVQQAMPHGVDSLSVYQNPEKDRKLFRIIPVDRYKKVFSTPIHIGDMSIPQGVTNKWGFVFLRQNRKKKKQ